MTQWSRKQLGRAAKITTPIKDEFWADRDALVEDPFGHHWSVATHIRDVSPKEMQEKAMQVTVS